MLLPSGRDWLFSIKTFAAGMLAVYLGLLMALPRPYWALATVYICSQPLSGATRSKAAFRVIGTLVGAAAAIALVPTLVNAPVVLVLAMTGWVAICLYVSLLDRSPRSYTFMLAGYTAALIGFPTVLEPGSIFDIALARVEEIILGIACASLVSTLVWPSSVGAVVTSRINAWLAHAARLSRDALTGQGSRERGRHELVRLAGEAADIDMLSTHLAFDTSRLRDTRRHLGALRLRMLMLLPVLSSIIDRLDALGAAGGHVPPRIAQLVEELSAWINPGPPSGGKEAQQRESEQAEVLRQAFVDAAPRLGPEASWADIMVASLLLRLRELLDIASDTRMLRRAIGSGRANLPGPLRFDPHIGPKPIRHRDHAMAFLSCVGVAMAILISCFVWIATGWPDGASAPMMAAVACCFFASRDDPVPAILQFANFTVVAAVIMAVYQFAILPTVHDFEVLALVLAPAFLFFGVLIAMPATMGIGLALAANGSTILAVQSTFAADFASYANSIAALLVGMYSGAIVMRITRSVGAEWAIGRMLRIGRRTIASAAERRGRGDRGRFAALMIDRIALLAPRLAAISPDSALRDIDLLAGARIGLNIVDLRAGRHYLAGAPRARIDEVLMRLAAYYARRDRTLPPDLLGTIDDAIANVMSAADEGRGRDEALLGLVGIRRGLFPSAEPYRAPASPAPLPERIAA